MRKVHGSNRICLSLFSVLRHCLTRSGRRIVKSSGFSCGRSGVRIAFVCRYSQFYVIVLPEVVTESVRVQASRAGGPGFESHLSVAILGSM